MNCPDLELVCLFRREDVLVQLINMLSCLIALDQGDAGNFACLGEMMADTHGIRAENPTEKSRHFTPRYPRLQGKIPRDSQTPTL